MRRLHFTSLRRYATTWSLLATLIAVIVVLDLTSMRRLSVTYDEPNHARYAYNILKGDSSRFNDSVMPVSALNALPMALAGGPSGNMATDVRMGRYVTVCVSVLAGLVVFAWARRLHGDKGGLLALTLYAVDPNLLAHSQLFTTDIYAAGSIALSLFTFWRYLHRGSWQSAVIAGLSLGLALIAKYTSVVLFPLFGLIALLFHASAMGAEMRARDMRALAVRLGGFCSTSLLFLLLAVAVINAAFLFNRTGTPLRDYQLRSKQIRSIQASDGLVTKIPLPVPYPYVEGLDWILQRERTGEGYGSIYLRGELREGAGFPGYYFWASLYKVPLATQLLLVVSVVTFASRVRRFDDLRDQWVIFVPVVFFAIYFNFFYRAQIGIRHYLVVFPPLYVFAGQLLRSGAPVSRRKALGLSAALVALALSVLSYYPHFLPYFNELIGNRRLAYQVLADSNIDWGQHRWYQDEYLKSHPQAIIEPEHPVPGTILVGVNQLTGVGGDRERFRWLRDNFRPVDDIAHAVLVYRVYPIDLERVAGARRGD